MHCMHALRLREWDTCMNHAGYFVLHRAAVLACMRRAPLSMQRDASALCVPLGDGQLYV
jgi:hypothetical protein